MEVFKVWSTFDLKGNALEKISRFTELTKIASAGVGVLNKELKALSTSFASVNLNAAGAIPELSKLSTLFVRLNTNSSGARERFFALDRSMDSLNLRTQSMISGTERLAHNLNYVAITGDRAAASLGAMRSIGSGSLRLAGSSGGGGRRGFHLSHMGAYGLAAVGGELGAIGAAATIGAPVAAAAGLGIMLKQGFDAQSEFQQQVLQLKGSGLTDSQLKEAVRIAYMSQKGISTIGRIKSLNDAFMATKNWDEAKNLAPFLAEAEFAGNATFKNMTDQQRQFLIKFAEMRAGSDLSRIPGAMDLGYRLMNASAGTLDPRQQAQFMKQASSVAYHLSDRGYAELEPVMQEFTGTRSGTAYQTGYQMLATGIGTLNNKRRVEDLIKLGIYKGGTKDKSGRYTSTTVDKDWLASYETAPFEFLKKLISAYKNQGTVSVDDINRRLALDFPRLTSQWFSLMMKNSLKIESQASLFDKQPGIQGSFIKALNIPSGATERLSNAWSSLATSFGVISSPLVIRGMNLLSKLLETLSAALSNFHSMSWSEIPSNFSKNQSTMRSIWNIGRVGDLNHNGFYSNLITSPISSASVLPQTIILNHTTNIDGKAVAKSVTKHQTNSMHSGGVSRGTSQANIGLTPVPTNLIRVGT